MLLLQILIMMAIIIAMMTVVMYAVNIVEGKMKVSREQVTENRRTILDAASRLFRERGFEAVTVAEIMKAAGLTHGGFYGYFTSKEELVANAVAEAYARRPVPSGDLMAYAVKYLSSDHRDNRAGGCPTAGLAAETVRQAGRARAEMTTGLKRQIARFSDMAPGASPAAKRRAAIGGWAAMVGAMIMARAIDDPAFSDEVLNETLAWLKASSKATSKATSGSGRRGHKARTRSAKARGSGGR
jgi:TetR/AcrR family transcriptional regulator, transcriptional repressor for nem operon